MKARDGILRLLAERIGLDPESLGRRTIDVAIERRMQVLSLGGIGAYLRKLRTSKTETEALAEEIVVPETWFFRDGAPFRYLEKWVLREWLPGAGSRVLRVLSAGCCTGEEPYSIAAVLLDAGLDGKRIDVLGTDISRRALETARAGLYRERMLRPGVTGHRARFFDQREREIRVKDELKRSVRFSQQNLVAPDLLSAEPLFDVVFCRNVLIYQNAEARRRMFRSFHRCLADDGLLFVGHAEPTGVPRDLFESAGPVGIYGFRKARPTATPPAASTTAPRARSRLPHIQWRDFGDASQPGEDALVKARRMADGGLLREAAEICTRLINQGPSAEALFLLGTIAHGEGREQEAEELLQKAIYLDSGHHEALVQLALLAEGRGDEQKARTYRRRAGRAVQAEAGS